MSKVNVFFSNENYSKQGVLNFCAGNGLASLGLKGQYDLVMEHSGGYVVWHSRQPPPNTLSF